MSVGCRRSRRSNRGALIPRGLGSYGICQMADGPWHRLKLGLRQAQLPMLVPSRMPPPQHHSTTAPKTVGMLAWGQDGGDCTLYVGSPKYRRSTCPHQTKPQIKAHGTARGFHARWPMKGQEPQQVRHPIRRSKGCQGYVGGRKPQREKARREARENPAMNPRYAGGLLMETAYSAYLGCMPKGLVGSSGLWRALEGPGSPDGNTALRTAQGRKRKGQKKDRRESR